MDFKESMKYLDGLKGRGMVLGLDNIKRLMEAFYRPDKKLKFIHIGGTNGKGSLSTYLGSVLREAGYRTGVYTSPEIYSFNERFEINGKMISDEEIAEILTDIKIISQAEDIPLTAFEAETALAVLYFMKNGCDFAVMEVGLGGRLDATNFIERPELGVFVEIGLDHMGMLGDTIEEIAGEKAGIIKENSHFVSYAQDPRVKAILGEEAKEKNADISYMDLDDVKLGPASIHGQVFSYGPFEDVKISMLGSYQPYNGSLAILAIERLRDLGYDISDEAVYKGMERARIHGRFEVVNKDPLVIVDGAHNEDGAKVFAESLDKFFPGKKHLFIYGSMEDKDYNRVLDIAMPYAKCFYTVMPDNDRALSSFTLKDIIMAKGGKAVACGSLRLAIRQALRDAGPEDTIVCFGSLYQVGEIMKYFNVEL